VKKILVFIMFLCVATATLQARPIDVKAAEILGLRFVQANFETRSNALSLVYTAYSKRNSPSFYIFNVGNNGFVIISADDCFRPIIGYSEEGIYNVDDVPPALSAYLETMVQDRSVALNAISKADPLTALEWRLLSTTGKLVSRNSGRGVDYLCQTKWNQDYPYNYCCPEDPAGPGGHVYVGCLATSMSQLMKFWNYPVHGIGEHSYIHENYGEISANFGDTYYDWENMPNILTSNAPVEQLLAVGTIGFHCGVSIDMGYGPDGSGGGSLPILDAEATYFNYSDEMQFIRQSDYDIEDWKDIFKESFEMGWPCYYGGCQDGGCHAFICDGYDDYDLFHFNFGWGGSGNGWFLIGEAAFTASGDAIVNFVPAEVYDNTPSAPTDLIVVPDSDVALSASISWKNPTTTLNGEALNAIDEIVVMRNSEIIYTQSNVVPGEEMSIIDSSVPLYDVYKYSVYAVHGRHGKVAIAKNISFGPSCEWNILMNTTSFQGFRGGYISLYNATGKEVARVTTTTAGTLTQNVTVPLGQVSFGWTQPEDSIANMSFIIKDPEGSTVFSYSGSSGNLPAGVFLNVNNGCGNPNTCDAPIELWTSLDPESEENILVSWTTVENNGHGYLIYRDDIPCRLVKEGNTFIDNNVPFGGHCYQASVLCESGETEAHSNESCISSGPCYPPRDLDFEITDNLKVKLMWNHLEVAAGLSGYLLYRKSDGEEDYQRIKLLSPNATNCIDNAVSAEGDYYYKLYAYYSELDCTSAPANRFAFSNVFVLHVYYSPTIVDGALDSNIQLYPNPTEGGFSVEAENMNHVSVYSMTGQKIYETECVNNRIEINLKHFESGIYFVKIRTASGDTIKKLSLIR
jgi:Peptidase C10 family.